MQNCNITCETYDVKIKNSKRNMKKRLNNFHGEMREICIIKSRVRVAPLRKLYFAFKDV